MRWILERLGLWVWTQNLKAEDNDGSWFHRRGWIRHDRKRLGFRWCLCVGGSFRMWGMQADAGDGDRNDEIGFALYCWPVMLWLGVETGREFLYREWGLTLNPDGWHLRCEWGVERWQYPSRIGWQWSCFLPDVLLGRQRYTDVTLFERDAVVAMPEGNYPARARVHESTWKRPRWPWPLVRRYVTLDVEGGIPFPGKGENSWDCGDDATYSMSVQGESIEDATAQLRERVLQRRERYGGKSWRPRDGWPKAVA